MYCVRSQSYIPIILAEYGEIGFGLNSRHRRFLLEHFKDYDYVAFAEEDMILTASHFSAFIQEEKFLQIHLPNTWHRYSLGFIRYEDGLVDPFRVSWEYTPDKIHVATLSYNENDNNKNTNSNNNKNNNNKNNNNNNNNNILGKYVVTNNLNQAIYVLSRYQLQDLEKRCDFLSNPGN